MGYVRVTLEENQKRLTVLFKGAQLGDDPSNSPRLCFTLVPGFSNKIIDCLAARRTGPIPNGFKNMSRKSFCSLFTTSWVTPVGGKGAIERFSTAPLTTSSPPEIYIIYYGIS